MRITLENNFVIDIDDRENYTLLQITGTTIRDEKEVEVTKNYGYHSNLKNALNKYIRLQVNNCDYVLTIKEYITRYEKLQNDILKGFGM